MAGSLCSHSSWPCTTRHTELLVFPATLTLQHNFTIQLASSTTIPSSSVRNLGGNLWRPADLHDHIERTARSRSFALHNIRKMSMLHNLPSRTLSFLGWTIAAFIRKQHLGGTFSACGLYPKPLSWAALWRAWSGVSWMRLTSGFDLFFPCSHPLSLRLAFLRPAVFSEELERLLVCCGRCTECHSPQYGFNQWFSGEQDFSAEWLFLFTQFGFYVHHWIMD